MLNELISLSIHVRGPKDGGVRKLISEKKRINFLSNFGTGIRIKLKLLNENPFYVAGLDSVLQENQS